MIFNSSFDRPIDYNWFSTTEIFVSSTKDWNNCLQHQGLEIIVEPPHVIWCAMEKLQGEQNNIKIP